MSRLDNWQLCWLIALDHPLTGAGFEFQSRDIVAKYAPDFLLKYGGKVWDTHNIFFGILTRHGFPGLAAFLLMILCCLMSCWRLKRIVRDRPDLSWVKSYSEMIQLSFLGFLINGCFVNMEYFDLPYHWIAIVASLKVIVDRALAEVPDEDMSVAAIPVAAAAS